MTRIVVMGPSGSGKSTVGRALADRLAVRFIDADDLHPQANVEKMAAGVPLDDTDRMPWLALVGTALNEADDIVIACSALKRAYRDAIRSQAPDAFFAELSVSRAVLQARVSSRGDHFMPTSLVDSQLQTWEPLEHDEAGVRVDESADVDQATAIIRDALETRTV
ncbi:gluconokinase [Microbacterium saperdae]|uniref:Gluconokinase n=1 Tax=Microbacterium saperdae TaxID=69368 RepID=A0A543BKI0_9MICO|nr:gluconokinase [Microbacterium saperdae]TQL85316.1 gluconokinase [Microbacterium saperdae]GGM55241.1 gluconokinase [Microbacterium saperdae]